MSERNNEKMWFAPKHHGYGAGFPISWEGWAVLAAFLAGVGFVAWFANNYLLDSARTIFRFGGVGVLLIAFVLIAQAKTKRGWRWRNDD